MSSSPFYKNSGKISLASHVSMHFRKTMFNKFMQIMQPQPHYKVLDIGVTSDNTYQESNYFEKMYPYTSQIICIGTENGRHLEKLYPGLKFQKVKTGQPYRFKDKEFDIAFSNAVLEHVGNTEEQTSFVREIARVSKTFFITTPNRWFPVEFHTVIPFLHFLPKNTYRKILSMLGESYWSKEENLNILSKRELRNLFPKDAKVVIDSVRLLGFSTNLIIHGNSCVF